MLYLRAFATGAVVLAVGFVLAFILFIVILGALVFRPGPGSPEYLRRLPAASLIYPGSHVLGTWDEHARFVPMGSGSAQVHTTYSREPGVDAAEDIIRWYEDQLQAMGWHFYGATTHSVGGTLRHAMWCTTQANALLNLWFNDPEESPEWAHYDQEFQLQLQATDPDRPNGSCAPSVTPERPDVGRLPNTLGL